MKIEIAENEVTLKLNKEQFKKIINVIKEENFREKKYIPKTKEELKELIKDERIYLGDIDTSNITDMSYLFYKSKRTDFSGIENWDTSNVTDMEYMFAFSNANPDVSNWDVSNVTDISCMFKDAIQANPDVRNWNFNKIKYAKYAFLNSSFDCNTLKSTNFDLNKLF